MHSNSSHFRVSWCKCLSLKISVITALWLQQTCSALENILKKYYIIQFKWACFCKWLNIDKDFQLID